MDDRLRQADPLPIAFRQVRAQPARHVGDARALHDLPDALAAFGGGDAFDLRDELEILGDAHVGIERRRFRQVARAALGFDRLLEHVEPRDDGLAVGRRHVAGQDPHRRGLAGAVGPRKPRISPRSTREADIVDRGHPAVPFREVLNLNHAKLLWTSAGER